MPSYEKTTRCVKEDVKIAKILMDCIQCLPGSMPELVLCDALLLFKRRYAKEYDDVLRWSYAMACEAVRTYDADRQIHPSPRAFEASTELPRTFAEYWAWVFCRKCTPHSSLSEMMEQYARCQESWALRRKRDFDRFFEEEIVFEAGEELRAIEAYILYKKWIHYFGDADILSKKEFTALMSDRIGKPCDGGRLFMGLRLREY